MTSSWVPALAASIGQHARSRSAPRSARVHLLPQGDQAQLFVADGSRLYDLPLDIAGRFDQALAAGDEARVADLIGELALDAPPAIDDTPPRAMPVHALSLAVAQKCNLACTYCYAQQGDFGGPAKNMSVATALRAVDLLLADKPAGSKAKLAFLGGEPLANRAVLQTTTEYAAARAGELGVALSFSITTNGTLVKPADAEFFERHGFAVTVSLDGSAERHDRLRPLRNGRGSFALILKRIAPLLELQQRMQVSARVTVTPANLELPQTLDEFVRLGFHSIGFSPLLRAPNGRDEMDGAALERMLDGMIACGLAFEQHVLADARYPFLNMLNALRELHRGTHRPYPCGAGAGYFGVSADGELAACHRFVGDAERAFGDVQQGVDASKQRSWLAQRHVHRQEPCNSCWARYLCGGGCHHEVLARGRSACDYIRGWLHYTIEAYGRLSRLRPDFFVSGAA
jgi:uncharacterized protein